MNLFITSDTHFGHRKLEELGVRPDSGEARLIRNWKEQVNPGDLVIHLGDVYFGPAGGWEDLIFNLPGRKILVRGNHDDNFLCDPEVDLDADDVRYL